MEGGRIKQSRALVSGGLAAAVVVFGLAAGPVPAATPAEAPAGLEARNVAGIDSMYLRPDADFSAYRAVFIEPAEVEFDREWSRDVRRTGSRVPLSSPDRDRLREETAASLVQSLAEEFERSERFRLVDEPGPGVLRITPRLYDVFITAHDPFSTISPNRRDLVSNAGRATFFARVTDSADDQVLAQVTDRAEARDFGHFRRATPSLMATDIEVLFSDWAKALRLQLEANH